MSIKKKIISCVAALAIAATSAATFTGCSDVSYALVVDGVTIPSGVYILYSGYALSDAEALLEEEQPDLDTTADDFDYYDQTVSGMSFADYVKQKTVNYCKRYVAVSRLFDELGIKFDATQQENMTNNINNQWDYSVSSWSSYLAYLDGFSTLGDYYQSIGVAKSSYKEVMTDSAKASEIFTYYYGEGGVEEVPRSEIEDYIEENYTLARYFSISLKDSEGEIIEDKDELANLEKIANGYVDDLNNGDSYAEVYAKYDKYFNSSDDEEEEDDEDKEEEEHEDSDYDRIISATSTSPSEEFIEALFAQDYGTAALFKADTYYYVVQRLDITENEEYVDDYVDTALNALRGDDLEDVFETKYADYSVTENNSAPDYARQQATNAMQGLGTLNAISYYSYYSSLFNYGY